MGFDKGKSLINACIYMTYTCHILIQTNIDQHVTIHVDIGIACTTFHRHVQFTCYISCPRTQNVTRMSQQYIAWQDSPNWVMLMRRDVTLDPDTSHNIHWPRSNSASVESEWMAWMLLTCELKERLHSWLSSTKNTKASSKISRADGIWSQPYHNVKGKEIINLDTLLC